MSAAKMAQVALVAAMCCAPAAAWTQTAPKQPPADGTAPAEPAKPAEQQPAPAKQPAPPPSGGGIINTDMGAPKNVPALADLPALRIPKRAGERALPRVPEQELKKPFAITTLGLDYHMFMPSSEAKWAVPFLEDFDNQPAPSLGSLNLVIGGLHFFDRADLYFSLPLVALTEALGGYTNPKREVELSYLTVAGGKFYPMSLSRGTVRPYVSGGLASRTFTMTGRKALSDSLERDIAWVVPIGVGVTWRSDLNLLVDASLSYPLFDTMTAHGDVAPKPLVDDAGKQTTRDVELGALTFTLGLRWARDTNGHINQEEYRGDEAQRLARMMRTKSAGGLTLAVGLSTRLAHNGSDYFDGHRPFLAGAYDEGFFPHATIGWYHFEWDAEVRAAWRMVSGDAMGYGATMETGRQGFFVEAIKMIDIGYFGFVPWIGIGFGYELLELKDSTTVTIDTVTNATSQRTESWSDSKAVLSIPFGWDLRISPSSWWFLRTSLRWIPVAEVEVAKGVTYDFGGLEFDFIQFVMYPGRLMKPDDQDD